MVPAKVGGASGASNEAWATGHEQSTQASTATLRAATTQRPPQGCLEGEGAANRDDVEPAPPPKLTQAPTPSSRHDTGRHLPEYREADHEIRLRGLLTEARWKGGTKARSATAPPAARHEEGSAWGRNWTRKLPRTSRLIKGVLARHRRQAQASHKRP